MIQAARTGFGLVELMVALVILSIVVLGFGAATARLVTSTARSAAELTAIAHADDRIDRIRAELAYDSLEAWYSGVDRGLEGIPSATRTTRIRHVRQPLQTGRLLDYKRITTTIEAPALQQPVSRTVTVAAP